MLSSFRLFPLAILFVFVTIALAVENMPFESDQMDKRLDCNAVCSTTGFSGNIGGCQCGYTLFSKRNNLHMCQLFPCTSLGKTYNNIHLPNFPLRQQLY